MAVRTRKRGKTYSYVFEAGKTKEGKRRPIEKGGFPTAQDAYEAGLEAYISWKHGNVGITSKSMSLSQIANSWLEHNRKNLKSSSYIEYERLIKTKIEPYFADTKVQDITPLIIDVWINKLADDGLSRNYVKKIHSLMRSILGYAIYPCSLIQVNPANDIKIPKSCPDSVVKRRVIAPDVFIEILQALSGNTTYKIPISLAYMTGMRIGEVLGLTWDSIDFDKNIIYVTQQLRYLKKIGNCITSVKNKPSERTILFDDDLKETLLNWKLEQDINRELLGKSYNISFINKAGIVASASAGIAGDVEEIPFVCTQKNGKHMTVSTIGKLLQRLNVNSHSFRHSHATLLVEAGATPKGIALRLGHSSLTTQNTYTHDTLTIKQNTLQAFEEHIKKGEPER